MSNSNLKTFDNFYADLAQSSYRGRPNLFPYERLPKHRKEILDSGGSISFDFSQDVVYKKEITSGGKNLDNDGKVYLQPDPDLHTERIIDYPYLDDDNEFIKDFKSKLGIGDYQKGLMTDELAGFNSYFLTDTPTLEKNTKKTYMPIRGSDGFNIDKLSELGIKGLNLNDWVANDGQFAINHIHIPQAPLATEAMKTRIQEMREKASNATMDLTAHSLGTMVTVQGIAGLSSKDINKIGRVVLFDGPDTTKSLKKMGLSDEKIKKISEKIEYYVNPFDVVGMLNREHTITKLPGDSDEPLKKPVGKVNVLVPLHYTQITDPESSHDFGVFQSDGKGNLLTASEDFHPELLRAGEKLARLIATTLDSLRALGVDENVAANILDSIMRGEAQTNMVIGYVVFENFKTEYGKIVEEARKESIKWDREAIPRYQEQLRNRNLTGEKRILVRAQLLQTAAQLANFDMEDKVKSVKTLLSDAKEDIQNMIKETRQTAFDMVGYLSSSEVTNSAEDFNNLLADVKQTWRGKNVSPNG